MSDPSASPERGPSVDAGWQNEAEFGGDRSRSAESERQISEIYLAMGHDDTVDDIHASRSATPANALHLTVEDGIFLGQYVIWIGLILLRWNLIGARLAMTNRGLRNSRTCRAR